MGLRCMMRAGAELLPGKGALQAAGWRAPAQRPGGRAARRPSQHPEGQRPAPAGEAARRAASGRPAPLLLLTVPDSAHFIGASSARFPPRLPYSGLTAASPEGPAAHSGSL